MVILISAMQGMGYCELIWAACLAPLQLTRMCCVSFAPHNLMPRSKACERSAQSAPPSRQGRLTLKCSATSQDSKAEKRRLVETPQKMRPTSSTLKLLKCFVKQPKAYVATYVSAAFFRPLHASDWGHGLEQCSMYCVGRVVRPKANCL